MFELQSLRGGSHFTHLMLIQQDPAAQCVEMNAVDSTLIT